MTRKVTFVREGAYILCVVWEELHIDEVIAGLAEMRKLAGASECGAFVIDLTDALIGFSIIEVDAIIEAFQKHGFKTAQRIAFVRSRDRKIGRFAETAFYNNGWGNVKNFDTRGEAIRWVASDLPRYTEA